jgi:hypothetical protein
MSGSGWSPESRIPFDFDTEYERALHQKDQFPARFASIEAHEAVLLP